MFLVRPPYLVKLFFNRFLWRYKENNNIYLTFDDGPVPEVTPFVLETLQKYNAKATFFCVGENAEKHPDLINRILAEGHIIGNHSFNHLNGWKTSSKIYVENIRKCGLIIRSKLFRPPYGKITLRQSYMLRDYKIIMWDVLSGDYNKKMSEETCFRNIKRYARKGSIIVFHDSIKAKKNLFAVLPRVLDHLSHEGYSFVTIPE